jgi:hypothetical protein
MRFPDGKVRDGGAGGAVGLTTEAEILLDGATKADVNSMNLALPFNGFQNSTAIG